jgi:hypothetical protein
MKLIPLAAASLAVVSLLAACAPKGGGNVTAAAPAAGAPAAAPESGPDVQINLADLPRPRAGLWEHIIDNGDGKPDTMKTCLSGKTPTMPKMPPGCSLFSIKRTFLGHIVMDMNCTTPQVTMVMHSEASGDFQNNMSSDATMTMTSKQGGTHTTKLHSEAHYLGPCAPGQKPDDEAPSATN